MAICKECGARINKQAKFCSNCGCPVVDNSTENKIADMRKNVSHTPKKEKRQVVAEAIPQPKPKEEMGCMRRIFNVLLFSAILLIIMFLPDMCDGCSSTDSEEKQEKQEKTEKVVENVSYEKPEIKKQEENHQDFFENGYEYSASYRINREKGYGLSASYKYKIKIYNDGTTEIVEEIVGDEFPGHPSSLYDCKIDKKSESYRDVAATWYEVKFNSSYMLYVDEYGNIIELNVNGNNKTIQEAIASGDCRFGKFSKKKLNKSKMYICKTCGHEYNPDKEAIVSEDYCFMDYPQKCQYCGKKYTVREDGNGAGIKICSRCHERKQAVSIYESVTGRKVQ